MGRIRNDAQIFLVVGERFLVVASGAVRLSVGRYTTEAEVDRAAGLLVDRARAERDRFP